MTLQCDDKIGSYRILRAVGQGASGKVYQVEHLVTRRVEALKIPAFEITSEADQSRRFLREIQMQASLNHPNVASVHNAFCENGSLCLVMEWVEGEPLGHIMQRGPLSLNRIVSLVCQVLSALAHAHEHGVIHRDVKPSNIMVDSLGQVKLTDFGLARPLSDRELTRPGVALGSVHYMAPEQVRGLTTTDGRADLYSVGVLLYELTTGRKPFDGPDGFAVMKAQVEDVPVPPSQFVPSLPFRLNEAILRALNKDPAERFATAMVFLNELMLVLSELPQMRQIPQAVPPKRPASFKAARVAALLIMASVVPVAGFWGYQHHQALKRAAQPPPPLTANPFPPAPEVPSWALTISTPEVAEEPPKIIKPAVPPVSKPRIVRPVPRVQLPVARRRAAVPQVSQPPALEAPVLVQLPMSGMPLVEPPLEQAQLDSPAPLPEKRTGTVRRFLGKLNPLRIGKKLTEKPPPEQPNR
jgi:serine/threonine-protein kinase